jgi:hypothetical protein
LKAITDNFIDNTLAFKLQIAGLNPIGQFSKSWLTASVSALVALSAMTF